MSDVNLRYLERRAGETGAVEDQAAVLREKIRVGLLDRERVKLAAYCHDPVARLIEGVFGLCGCHESAGWCEHVEDAESEVDPSGFWVRGLSVFCDELTVLVRAAAAASFELLSSVVCNCFPRGESTEAVLALLSWLEEGDGFSWEGIHPPDAEDLDWWYYLQLLLWDLRTGPRQVRLVVRYLVECAVSHESSGDPIRAIQVDLACWALGRDS